MSLKNNLSPYLKFTPSERKGVFVLLLILILVVIVRLSLPYIKEIPDVGDITFDLVEINSSKQFNNQENSQADYNLNKEEGYFIDTTIRINPNLASLFQLQKIGFTSFAANNLLKYRKNGGVIYSLNDIIKIYGVDSGFVYKIKNQIIFAESGRLY